MVLLTLGTGIGSGIIVEGALMHGSHDMGAEMGHLIVESDGELCGCGQRGCLESYSSSTALGRFASRRIESDGQTSRLANILAEGRSITAKDINEARKAGDELAAEVWRRGMYYLAIACVSICRTFDPERIVLTGGMVRAGDDLLVPVREFFNSLHWSLTEPMTQIVLGELGSDAGAIGAAGVAWDAFGPEN